MAAGITSALAALAAAAAAPPPPPLPRRAVFLSAIVVAPALLAPGPRGADAGAAYAGDAACPCYSPLLDPAVSAALLGGAGCLLSKDGVCLPLGFGSTCQPWDASLSHCSGSSPPSWCKNSWCYVKAQGCERAHKASRELVNVAGLYYSYATCGSLDSYTPNMHLAQLTGKQIRISFPSPSENGYSYVITKDGKKAGAIYDFMHHTFSELNMDVVEVGVSNDSRGMFVSSYTACVHEVALNRTDMCLANFWETVERLQMATFTAQLHQDFIRLVTFSKEEVSLGTILSAPFKPFSGQVWLLIVIMIVVVALALYWVERAEVEGDFHGMSAAWAVVRTFYLAFVSVVSNAPSHHVKTKSGKLLNLCFGFFIIMVMATYTAQLTKVFLIQSSAGTIESLEEAVSARLHVCTLEALETSISILEPSLSDLLVITGTSEEALANMDSGICEASLLDSDSMVAAHAGLFTKDDRHCDKTMVGSVLLSIGNSMPIREDLQHAMTWAMTQNIARGTYLIEEARAKREFLGSSLCESNPLQARQGLQLKDAAGISIILGTGLVISLGGYLISAATSRNSESESEPPCVDKE